MVPSDFLNHSGNKRFSPSCYIHVFNVQSLLFLYIIMGNEFNLDFRECRLHFKTTCLGVNLQLNQLQFGCVYMLTVDFSHQFLLT